MTNVVVITDHKGTIFINRNTNEIDISGDNGLITLTFKTFTV